MKRKKFQGGKKSAGTDFSLKALRVFLMVEECGSMAVAAERMKGSPSGISQSISALEREVGGELFDRNVKPLALTPTGHILKKHATAILDVVGNARAELYEVQLAIPEQLRLAIINDFDAMMTPLLAKRVVQKYPGCVFSARSARSDAMNQMLVERKVDIIITADPPKAGHEFEIIPILSEPFVLCCAKGVIDPKKEIVPQLGSGPFIHFDSQMPLGRLLGQHMRRLKISPKMRYSFDATRSVLAMIRDQRGWGLVTPLCLFDSIRFKDSLDVFEMPFTGLSRTIYLISRRNEMGNLPNEIAELVGNLVREKLLPEVNEMMPWCLDYFVVHDGVIDPG